jgi:hypothetical protein
MFRACRHPALAPDPRIRSCQTGLGAPLRQRGRKAGLTLGKRRWTDGSIGAPRRDISRRVPSVQRTIRFPVGRRIGHPAVDRGFAPSATIVADLHLARKGPFLHFSVERGSAESDALQHGTHTQESVCLGHVRTAAAVLVRSTYVREVTHSRPESCRYNNGVEGAV